MCEYGFICFGECDDCDNAWDDKYIDNDKVSIQSILRCLDTRNTVE